MAVHHWYAPEVQRIAERLIAEEAQFRPLRAIRIEYLFRSTANKNNGKIIFGKASKVSSMNAYLATPDIAHDPEASSEGSEFFLMVIAHDMWEQALNDQAKEALVFHELCHYSVYVTDEGDRVIGIIGHDLEDFSSVIRRYGAWRPDVRSFFEDVGHDVLSLFAESIDGQEEPFK